jgi:uncharacterized protein involved in exopolysaccharide biosynthesis
LRRRGLILLLAAVTGGIAGYAIADLTPPRYLGTARVGLTASLAAADAAEVLSQFRAALVEPAVIRAAVNNAAVNNAAVKDVDPADLMNRVTSRVAGAEFTVDVSWSDPDTAAALATGMVDAVVADIARQQARYRELKLRALQGELHDAERLVDEAREALLKFYRTPEVISVLADVARFGQASDDPSRFSNEVAVERARITALSRGLATSTQPRGDVQAPADLIAMNEAVLTNLAARRDYAARLLTQTKSHGTSTELARVWMREVDLTGAYLRALGDRNGFADAYQLHRSNMVSGLERRGEQVSTVRTDRLTTRTAIILGAASALVLAMFGVILFDALTRSR